jgi:predicted pyridoxine 5'-phosphate oxidase superfamily flavin-nucleotide-binding protein
MNDAGDGLIPLTEIAACFEGLIPATIATASADGTPNVTHLSRVHMVDDDHVALSNQFFSKTVQNLAANPRACVCVVDPLTYDSYRLVLQYERTERRGPLFDRMRRDIDAIASLTGMEGVFKLRSADIYRVVELDLVRAAVHDQADGDAAVTR